ncbi:MAG: peptidylprolyl isomerase [Alphaproteobacteria bacterium]|nr:peptidylprolyl isomerase [Alphaproteobacteria bacterium]
MTRLSMVRTPGLNGLHGMKRHNTLATLAIVMVALVQLTLAPRATAQEVQRIAAIVNDEVVSVMDLVGRINLVIFSSGLQDSAETRKRIGPQVLRTLIDERLRLQEARRQNVSVTEAELRDRIRLIEQQNNIPENQISEFLKAQRIAPESMFTQIRSEISWIKLVRRRLQSTVTISDDEIDEWFDQRKASEGRTEYRLSEIFIIVENTREDTEMHDNATRIVDQLRGGADFENMARQLSNGVTAAAGGDAGWVLQEQLQEEVSVAVMALEPGQFSDPISTSGGYLIVLLRDRRERLATNPNEVKVALKQILLPISSDAGADEIKSQTEFAQEISGTLAGCDDMARTAAELDPSTSGDVGTVRIGDLPAALRSAVIGLEIGKISQPTRTEAGIHLLMVCERIEPPGSRMPSREEVHARLMENKLESLSRRYLRNLRREAFVDIRI